MAMGNIGPLSKSRLRGIKRNDGQIGQKGEIALDNLPIYQRQMNYGIILYLQNRVIKLSRTAYVHLFCRKHPLNGKCLPF